jgi:hypothetical protein
MLVYGQGCYETVSTVADGKVPSAAGSLDPFTLWNVFVESSESQGQAGSYRFVRQTSTDKRAYRHQLPYRRQRGS